MTIILDQNRWRNLYSKVQSKGNGSSIMLKKKKLVQYLEHKCFIILICLHRNQDFIHPIMKEIKIPQCWFNITPQVVINNCNAVIEPEWIPGVGRITIECKVKHIEEVRF